MLPSFIFLPSVIVLHTYVLLALFYNLFDTMSSCAIPYGFSRIESSMSALLLGSTWIKTIPCRCRALNNEYATL